MGKAETRPVLPVLTSGGFLTLPPARLAPRSADFRSGAFKGGLNTCRVGDRRSGGSVRMRLTSGPFRLIAGGEWSNFRRAINGRKTLKPGDSQRSFSYGCAKCAVSSVVEHFLDTEGVRGSNPLSRTIPPVVHSNLASSLYAMGETGRKHTADGPVG